MTFWYNAPKTEGDFGILNCNDYDTTNFSIKFDEVKVLIGKDGHYYFYGNAVKASDVKKYQEDGFKLDDHLVLFAIHTADYKKKKKVDGKYQEITVTPSVVETLVVDALKEGNIDTTGAITYRGVIDLGVSAKTRNKLLTGQDEKGQQLDADTLYGLLVELVDLTETEPDKLKNKVLSTPESGNSNNFQRTPAETEEQKLDARWRMFHRHFELGEGIQSLSDLAHHESQLDKAMRDLYFRKIELFSLIFK